MKLYQIKKIHKFVKPLQSETSSKNSKVNDREHERNEKQNKSDMSKVDKSKIQCYMCHKMGYYKSECSQTRKLEESCLVEDIIVRADEIPTRQEQKEALINWRN